KQWSVIVDRPYWYRHAHVYPRVDRGHRRRWISMGLPEKSIGQYHFGTQLDGAERSGFFAVASNLDLLPAGIGLSLPTGAMSAYPNAGYDHWHQLAPEPALGGHPGLVALLQSAARMQRRLGWDRIINHVGHGAVMQRYAPYFAGDGLWGPLLNTEPRYRAQ